MSSSENAVSTMKLDRGLFARVAVPTLGLFWLAVTTLPFIFVVMTSLKSQQETFTGSVWALPERLNFENYLAVLQGGFWVYLRNSVFVLVLSIGLILVISSMAAYASNGRRSDSVRRLTSQAPSAIPPMNSISTSDCAYAECPRNSPMYWVQIDW